MSASESSPVPSVWMAWLRVLAITLLGCIVLGLGCFVTLGRILPTRFNLFQAAVWQQVGFTVGLGIILVTIIVWQRWRGLSMADLGWGRPTTNSALVVAVILGVAYLSGAYFGAQQVLPDVNVLELNWVRIALIPLGIFMAVAEETMMRGFFMSELHRARVPTWLQILASGACSAIYHTLQNPSAIGFFPSFGLFSMHAALFVFGRRSLTAPIVAHSMYHVFGEPYLLMMVLATMKH